MQNYDLQTLPNDFQHESIKIQLFRLSDNVQIPFLP